MPGPNHCQYPQCGHSNINCVINSSNSRIWFDLMKEYFPENKSSVKGLFLCNCHFDKDDFILEIKPDAIPLKKKQHVESENFYANSKISEWQSESEWTPQMIETRLTVASSMPSNAYENLTKSSSIALPPFLTLIKNSCI